MELNTLTELCKKNNIPYKPFEPMRLHTSFKIGGLFRFYPVVRNTVFPYL